MKELSPEAKAILEAGRAASSPTAASKAAVLASVEAGIGSAGAVSAGVGMASLKLVGVIVVAAAALGGAWWSLRSGSEGERVAAVEKKSVVTPAESKDGRRPAVPVMKKTAAAKSQPPVAVTPTEETQPAAEAPIRTPQAKKLRQGRTKGKSPIQKQKNTQDSVSTLKAEQALIAAAQVAIGAGQYDKALNLLAEHKTKYSKGILAPERSAAIAIARCRSGKDGKSYADKFLVKYARSPLASQVKSSCKID